MRRGLFWLELTLALVCLAACGMVAWLGPDDWRRIVGAAVLAVIGALLVFGAGVENDRETSEVPPTRREATLGALEGPEPPGPLAIVAPHWRAAAEEARERGLDPRAGSREWFHVQGGHSVYGRAPGTFAVRTWTGDGSLSAEQVQALGVLIARGWVEV